MRSTELILILLFTLAISATLAQRSGRRFRPIGRREPEVEPLEDTEPLEEEQLELAKPRFTPSIRKLGTFRPKSSPESKQNVQPEKQSVQINPKPVQEQPRIAPNNRRSGGRGSRNFIESINAGAAAGLRTDQLEKLKTTGILSGGASARRPSSRSQNTVQRQSSRAQSIPSRQRPVAPIENENVKVETETPSFKSKPTSFKPLSRPKQKIQTKPISDDKPLQPLPVSPKEVDDAPIEEMETSKQSLRRERIEQLKNRKSSGSMKKSKMMVDKPKEEISQNPAENVSEVLTELESVDKKSMKKEVKLDSSVSKPLEQTIRETSTDEVTIAEQMMKAEKSQSKVKIDKSKVDTKLNLETSSQEPSTTKTTEASATSSTTVSPTTISGQSRRISKLTRVRPEKTRTRGSAAVTRTRGSAAVTRTRGSGAVSTTRGSGTVSRNRGSSPAAVTVQVGTELTTPKPRLSGRRGGRGNSRGGAALVTKNTKVGGTRSFTPRVSSRNRVNPAVNPDSSDDAGTTQPANRRSHSRSLPMTRRKLPSLSARFARVKKTIKLPESHGLTEERSQPEEFEERTTESPREDNISERPNLRNRIKLRNRIGKRRTATTPRSKKEKDNTRPSAQSSPRYVRFRNNRKIEVKEKIDVKDENKPIRKSFRRIDVTSKKVDSSPLSSRPNRFSLRRKLIRGGSSSRSQITTSEVSSRKELRTTTESAHKRVVENKFVEGRPQASEISTTADSSPTERLPNVQDTTSSAILAPVQQEIINSPLKGITERPNSEKDSESKSKNRGETSMQLENKLIADNIMSEIDPSEIANSHKSTPLIEMTNEQHEVKIQIDITTQGTFSLNGVKTIPTITAKRITVKPSVTELQNKEMSEETLSFTPDNTYSNRGTVRASTNRGRVRTPLRKTSTRESIGTQSRREMDADSQAKDDIVVTEKTETPMKHSGEKFPLEKGPVMAIKDEEFLQEPRDESSTKRTQKERNEVTSNPPEQFVLKVAPEDPRDAINRGGLKFRPHDDSERDLKRGRNGEVIVTQIGTRENTPLHQVQSILSGLGGRRRGLARPPKKQNIFITTTEDPKYLDYNIDDYYIYDY